MGCIKGGEITEINQYDGSGWVRINGEPAADKLNTIPGYTLKDNQGTTFYLAYCPDAVFQVVKTTTDEIVLNVEGHPRSADGIESGWIVKQTFRVFKEGLLFCDLEMNLPDGSDPFNVSYARLGPHHEFSNCLSQT